jgi:hypothetical protein
MPPAISPPRTVAVNLYNCGESEAGFFDFSGIAGFYDFAAALAGIAG